MNRISAPGGMVPDAGGWCLAATRDVSPNFDQRPGGTVVDLLVIHNISLPSGQYETPYIADLFCNRLDCKAHPSFENLLGVRVSAHFLIRRGGELIQFVSTDARAWHAGVSSFGGRERCNDFSIGIEVEGTDNEAFSERQYLMLGELTHALRQAYPLTDVVGHEHIAPGRKSDPGPFFDWTRYREAIDRHRTWMPETAPLRFMA